MSPPDRAGDWHGCISSLNGVSLPRFRNRFCINMEKRTEEKIMARMRVAQVSRAKGPIEIVERPIPEPGPGAVRIKVSACGICHSDAITKEGLFPNIQYPRVPGHEVTGVIDAMGPGVAGWQPGQRVGVGWNGGYCGYCDHCRRGDFFACVRGQSTGVTYDGGYAEYMVAPANAVALMPAELSPVD